IVRIGAMGDVLHAMPAVAALRERHPEWVIGWAIEPVWRELLQAESEFHDVAWKLSGRDSRRPLVDQWSPVPTREWKRRPFSLNTLKDIRRLRQELLGDRYDICVDIQGSIRSAMVGRMAGAGTFAGAAAPREAPAAWFYKQKIRLSATHVVEQGCELLGAAVGETLTPAKVTLPVDPVAEQWCEGLLAGVVERFALMAPTAGWGAKRWPAERYGAVAAALGQAGFRTLVNAESLQDEAGIRVVEASGGAATLVPCSVGQMIALVRRAGVVIAGDTGPLHLAAALERPVVGLYGPTDPARNGPYGTVSRVLRHAWSKTDHSRTHQIDPGLLLITVDEVVEAALELLHAGQDKVKV
ncbi:MAG TPA: glycosyltransferase family 9 protein, partial [Edaphobacter sp.]|nr:glycosyltransferase family 9 protein [Edaphobacter sp.]